ncbi:hypothetical protein V6N11_074959 [Hibiscus sabdariffa]|uniref:Uncharacterized protein n=1 Tax=Hibiscus sabdariffa TaxID=183260 RepID=A0ABR2R545_9ROSI
MLVGAGGGLCCKRRKLLAVASRNGKITTVVIWQELKEMLMLIDRNVPVLIVIGMDLTVPIVISTHASDPIKDIGNSELNRSGVCSWRRRRFASSVILSWGNIATENLPQGNKILDSR